MNRLEIEGSGFPATNQTWRFLRDMINEVHQLTAFGGDTYILKGCEVDNGTVTDGFIVYQGELLRFQGGAIGTEVTIIEAVQQTTYLEDLNNDGVGDDKDTYFVRHATFGSAGVVTFNWDSLVRLNPLLEIQRRLPPKKIAYDYYGDGTDLAEGWQFCDGTNGTPDLRGMFIVGQDPNNPDYEDIGSQGGTENVTLTVGQMPQHNHNGNVVIPPHKHALQGKTAITHNGEGGDGNRLSTSDNIGNGVVSETSLSASQSVSLTTVNKGSGEAHENRPPYYALAKITDVGV